MGLDVVYYIDRVVALWDDSAWMFPLGMTPQQILLEVREDVGRPLAIASTDFVQECFGGSIK
jgi:hypothetical protein